jgi:hypothetical protein
MRAFLSAAVVLAAAIFSGVVAVDPTDEYRDADIEQSGYLPNHNMDPAIVNSPQFGLLWKIPFNAAEQVRSYPSSFDWVFCCDLRFKLDTLSDKVVRCQSPQPWRSAVENYKHD